MRIRVTNDLIIILYINSRPFHFTQGQGEGDEERIEKTTHPNKGDTPNDTIGKSIEKEICGKQKHTMEFTDFLMCRLLLLLLLFENPSKNNPIFFFLSKHYARIKTAYERTFPEIRYACRLSIQQNLENRQSAIPFNSTDS